MLILEDKTHNTEYKVKTSFDEITVEEFQKASEIYTNDKIKGSTRKYLDIMEVYGLPTEIKNRVGSTTLMNFVREVTRPQTRHKLKESYELDNYTYTVNLTGKGKSKTIDLTALQQADIEEIFLSEEDVIIDTLKVLLLPEGEEIDDTKVDSDIRNLSIGDGINFIYEVEKIMENGIKLLEHEVKSK